MKNFIYLNNNKELEINKVSNEKQIIKLSNIKNLKMIINDKFSNLLNSIYKPKDYNLIVNINYQKILAFIIIQICTEYIQKNNKKPHIIISYYESNFLLLLCKKLVKNGIVEDITIINNFDIINEIKMNKKSNTLFAIISNINNNISYNLSRLSNFCKYYNIIFITNVENAMYNYIYDETITNNEQLLNNNLLKYYIYNQDILFLNYYTNNLKIYFILIKKSFQDKYKINNKNILYNLISKDTLVYLINILSYYKLYYKSYLSINNIYNYFLSSLNQNYRIIEYTDFNKIKDIYFTNSATIILFNKISNNTYLLNNILLSIYIPNIKFTNKQLIEYIKLNGIITNTNYNLPNNLSKTIINGIINIQISHLTKLQDINKLIKVLINFINTKNTSLISTNKKKKHIHFSTPEYIILTKPAKLPKKQIKSILKK